jgi:hypothetical protein
MTKMSFLKNQRKISLVFRKLWRETFSTPLSVVPTPSRPSSGPKCMLWKVWWR